MVASMYSNGGDSLAICSVAPETVYMTTTNSKPYRTLMQQHTRHRIRQGVAVSGHHA